MSNRRRTNMQAREKPALPPIVNEDDGELPFMKQDFFSDVALIVKNNDQSGSIVDHHGAKPVKNQTTPPGKKLYTARCLLAYNSPVFEKSLGNAKKHEMDLSNKNCDDIVELLCYLDPRVPYTITAQSARQLLPLAEEYEIMKLRKLSVDTLTAAYDKLRKEYSIGTMPKEVNEEYLVMSDRYNIDRMLEMCIEEYIAGFDVTSAKSAMNSETLSEKVKLLILQKKLAKLNAHLDKERMYKAEAEQRVNKLLPKTHWKKYWHSEQEKDGMTSRMTFASQDFY